MTEKRVHKRIPVKLPARYKVIGSSQKFLLTTVVNISAAGISFTPATKILDGQQVIMQIWLDANNNVTITTQVVWSQHTTGSNEYQVGVKVINSDTSDAKRFIKFYCDSILILHEHKKRILIIEDEKDLSNLLFFEMKQQGYEPICASNGQEGYQKYITEHPDLIILDIMLPELNGLEVCRKIRRESKDNKTPIIILTAKAEDTDKIVGKVIGADVYMVKPFERKDLLDQVKTLLEKEKG